MRKAGIMKRGILLVCILSCMAIAADFNACKYGAKADANSVSTEAIQRAIDVCYSSGGGDVMTGNVYDRVAVSQRQGQLAGR
jgi:polygalacturonase